MRYQILGPSGLRVSELCLGTMTFGPDWGWGADYDESKRIFERYTEAGGNFIDTANLYTNGTSERYVGDFIQAERDHFVVATKYTLATTDTPGVNARGNSRKNMVQAVEHSLKRLKTDVIDLLYLHAWDYYTPVEEVMRGLDDLVRMGKVMYVLISDTPAYIIAEANTMATLRGWSRFLGIQAPYSLLQRDLEREIFPMAKHWDMAVLPWGILKAGVLTGKFLQDVDEPTRVNPAKLNLSEQELATVQEVVKIAGEVERTPSQVAVNWVRQQQHRAQVIPILGARKLSQLEDNLACLEWALSEEQLQRLDAISQPDLGFPHTFLPNNAVLHGDYKPQIDAPRGLDIPS